MKPPPHQNPVTRRDVATGARTALLSRLGAVIEIVAQPAYTWMFGLATYGLYTVLWALVNLIENIADLGMTDALQRTLPQARTEEDAVGLLRAALVLGVMPATLIAAVASVAAPLIAPLFNVAASDQAVLVTAIRLFAWALPLWAFIEVSTAALRARRAFGPEIRVRVVWEQIFRLIFAALLWAAGAGTLGLLIAHLASLSVTALASARLLSRYYDLRLLLRAKRFDRAHRDLLWAGGSVLPANIIARLFGDAPPVVINFMIPGGAGAAAAGLYGIARKLSSIPQLVRMAFSYVMGPLASAQARLDRSEIQHLFAFATRLSVLLVIPLGIALLVSADLLLKLFAPGAEAALPMLIALTIARMIEAVCGPANAVQRVIGRLSWPVVNSFIGLVTASIVTAALLPTLRETGVAIGVGTGLIITAVRSYRQLTRSDGLNAFAPPFSRVAVVSCAGAATIVIVSLSGRMILPELVQGLANLSALIFAWWIGFRFGLTDADRAAISRKRRVAGRSKSGDLPTIGFLYVGGSHQVLHTAPVAAELGRLGTYDVVCFTAQQDERDLLERLLAAYPDTHVRIESLPEPWWGRLIAAVSGKTLALKQPRLIARIRRLRQCTALVTTERTSTSLKRLALLDCPLIHIPHGAGDRAVGFEKRLKWFDLVIAAGRKDAERMVSEGVVAAGNIAVGGAVKLAALKAMTPVCSQIFANERPVVLYNPHFSSALGSWIPHGREIIAWFAGQTEYNLIVAPHIRLRENLTAAERAEIEALAVPGQILIDLGSPRSCDMSYTNAADIYLGDVSSQVYEFISRPRPCIFLNPHHVAWHADPNYACWHFGDVIDKPYHLAAVLADARARHAGHYRVVQEAALERALGSDWEGAAMRVAGIIADFLARDAEQPQPQIRRIACA